MHTFGLHRRGWWVLRAFGPNPLLRRTDRVEATVIVIAIVVAVAVIPIAAAVGSAVYGSHAQLYADAAHTRHRVAATVIESDVGVSLPHTTARAARARWRAGGNERTDWFRIESPAKVGDQLQVWVNDDGDKTTPPTPTSQACVDAVGVAAGTWFAVVLTLASLAAMTRSPLNRIRYAQWEREIKSLADGGRANRPG